MWNKFFYKIFLVLLNHISDWKQIVKLKVYKCDVKGTAILWYLNSLGVINYNQICFFFCIYHTKFIWKLHYVIFVFKTYLLNFKITISQNQENHCLLSTSITKNIILLLDFIIHISFYLYFCSYGKRFINYFLIRKFRNL